MYRIMVGMMVGIMDRILVGIIVLWMGDHGFNMEGSMEKIMVGMLRGKREHDGLHGEIHSGYH